MADTITTGFQLVTSGGTTQIDLSNYTSIESARIRWKGKKLYTESSSSRSNSVNWYTDLISNWDVPSVPFGWNFKEIFISTTVTNNTGDTIPDLFVSAGVPGGIGNATTHSNVEPNESRQAIYTHTSGYSSETLHAAYSNPKDLAVRMVCNSILRYWKYIYTRDPSVEIGGISTTYIGTLLDGVDSDWVPLTGLTVGQINTIKHSMLGTSIADVEIEYTVSTAPTIQTQPATNVSFSTAKINGVVSNEGAGTAHAYFEYGETQAFGTVIDIGTVEEDIFFSHDITGLDNSKTIYFRAYATNIDGTSYGATLSFTTLYPTLEAPTRQEPLTGARLSNRRPYFVMDLVENTDNIATKYHARIRFSDFSNIQDATVHESLTSQTGWELWNGTDWIAFPSIGVDPNSKVRFRPINNLNFATYYWDAASYDGLIYGHDLASASVRIMLSADGLYLLAINSVEYKAYSLSVLEASNGQIGEIQFELNNHNGLHNANINYGDTVNLAVKDAFGNSEEYLGKVRMKSIMDYALTITAIMGSGILSERRIKENYDSQDIGQTIKDIIDTYCSPLTTANVNIATGILAPITATDKTPLTILEELRSQYGIMYYADKDWDMHVYLPCEISEAFITVRHGGDM